MRLRARGRARVMWRARFRRRGEGEDELEGERDRMIMLNFALGHSLTMRLSKGVKQSRLYKMNHIKDKFPHSPD